MTTDPIRLLIYVLVILVLAYAVVRIVGAL